MQAIPEQLAEGLAVHLNSPVNEVHKDGILLKSGNLPMVKMGNIRSIHPPTLIATKCGGDRASIYLQ